VKIGICEDDKTDAREKVGFFSGIPDGLNYIILSLIVSLSFAPQFHSNFKGLFSKLLI